MPAEDDSKEDITEQTSGTYPAAEGRQVGRYEIFTKIASGGMAGIYLARQMGPEGFQRPVVIKRILRELVDRQEFVEMFLDEARIGAQISHPNVAQIYEFGRYHDTYFMALEYLFGETLSKAIRALKKRERRFDPVLAAHVVARAAAGLHHAHEMRSSDGTPMNVVHRDVSPQNLFLTYDGHVKVLDFGIAKAVGRATKTRAGQVKGKFAYMSPEQARGTGVDRRADVWSLGVVLYEMTTGTRLFDGPLEVELLYRLLEGHLIPPSEVVDDYPPELEAIVLRALKKDLDERYESARALKRDLDQYVASSGRVVGAEEIAELMSGLFVEERAKKEKLLDGLAAGGEPIESAFERSTETSLELPAARDVARARSRPPPRQGVPPWMLLLVVTGAIIGGVATALLTEDDSEETIASLAPSPEPEAAEPDLDDTEAPAPTPDEVPEPTACRVESAPPGASVWAAGTRLCTTTPCEIEACDGELELRLDGHAPATATVHEGLASATLRPLHARGRRRAVRGRMASGMRRGVTAMATDGAMMTTAAAPDPPPSMDSEPTMMRRGPRPQDLPPL